MMKETKLGAGDFDIGNLGFISSAIIVRDKETHGCP